MVSQILTLYITPVIYLYLENARIRYASRRTRRLETARAAGVT